MVSLLDRPSSGYDLARRFEMSNGYFWRATRQQIYAELTRMQQEGDVDGERVEQLSKPAKILYRLTDQGADRLRLWALEPSAPASAKEELLVKAFAVEFTGIEPLIADIQRRRIYHLERQLHFKALEQERYPDRGKLTLRQRAHWLGLRRGILHEKGWVMWCDEALAMLEEAGSSKPCGQDGQRAAGRPRPRGG